MTCAIIIDCETPEEIYQHLHIIKHQLKQKFKKIDLNNNFKSFVVSDDNCYGRHDCSVDDDTLESKGITRIEKLN